MDALLGSRQPSLPGGGGAQPRRERAPDILVHDAACDSAGACGLDRHCVAAAVAVCAARHVLGAIAAAIAGRRAPIQTKGQA